MYVNLGFYTGPNLVEYEFEVKCATENSTCTAESQGGDPVSGVLPSTLSYVTATVNNLESNTTYWCYVSSSLRKVKKCQGPLVGKTSLPEGGLVAFSLLYQQPPSFFTSLEREQVCRNLLYLSPNGTCVIDSVTASPARAVSSDVVGSVEYNLYDQAQRLYDDLSSPTNLTLTTLATGIVNSSSQVGVESAELEFVVKETKPGPPGFVMAPVVEENNATITWLDGKLGNPQETYSVNCVVSSNTPSSAVSCTDAGVNVTGIARGTESAVVTGLIANTTYSCWPIAVNPVASVCSVNPVVFRTLIAPDPATNVQQVSVTNTTTTIEWEDGSSGNPTETYSVYCVEGTSTTCNDPCGISATNIPRGVSQGTVVGLTPNTTYQCWVIGSNSVGDVCSGSPAQVTTWIEAGAPYAASQQSISNTSVTIDWTDGLEGIPTETYAINCVSGSNPTCTSTGIKQDSIARGTQTGTVTGLQSNTSYACYILASNSVGTVCSTSPVNVITYIEPGAPTNVGKGSLYTSWAVVTWDDGAEGRPQETYDVNCVVSSATASCLDAGVDATSISRGVQSANVTGLAANTSYSCWPIAGNTIGSVCSAAPVSFITWIQAAAPSSFSPGIVASTSVSFSWADGAPGNPTETYTIICTTDTTATDCLSPGGTVVQETGITRGMEEGTVSGMAASTSYACWVKAVNGAGETCSNKQIVTTPPALSSAQVIATDQSAIITPSSYTAPSGASNVTYQVQCLSSSATTCDPQATGTGALQPSPGQGSTDSINVSGLTNDVSYQCFSVASYTLNSVTNYACSGPVEVKPFPPPTLSDTSVLSGNQTITITPNAFSMPTGGSNVAYQVQCLSNSAVSCDPLATGTGALQPSTATSSPSAATVSGLTNNVTYQCFSVVTYTLNSETKYTCSSAAAAIPHPPPTLSTEGVIAGTQSLTITPNVFAAPGAVSNITYQVQCFQSLTTTCSPNSALSPSTGLSSPAPILLSGLQDRSIYSCFSVVSYMLNSVPRYTCSDVFSAMPYTQPSDLTAQGVISQNQTMTIYVASYSTIPAQTSVEYQVQCLDSSASVCNPLATGSGAVQPSPANTYAGFKIVTGLTTGTTYKCFSVISYTLLSVARKYTCSDPFEVIAAPGPILTTQKVLASSGLLIITPDLYTAPTGASNVGYQAQCFGSASSVCDLVNGAATPSTPLTSPGPITVGSLSNNQIQYCFSVVSYGINGTTRYACSEAFQAIPYTAPQTLSSSNVVSGNQTLTITPPTYSPPSGASSVQYQVQCLNSSATVCDPLATGTGSVQPSSAQSSLSPIVVSGLTNGVTYKCFSVVTYTLSSSTKYTCSASGYAAVPAVPPNFDYPYGIAINGSTMFVTNTNDNSVTACTISGLIISDCGKTGSGLNGPLGIAISGSTAYIANAGGNYISKCSISGSTLGSCSQMSTSSPSYSFNLPRGITLSGTTAFISSGPTGGVQIVTSCTISGSALSSCGSTGSNFNGPRTTAISGGTAYVTNYGSNTNSVTSCTVNSGVTPNSLGSCTTNGVNIGRATGIVIDGSTAYVSNVLDSRVDACTISSGTSPPSLTTCSPARTSLNTPNEIAIVGTVAYVALGGSNSVLACDVNTATSSLINCRSYT